MYTCAHSSWFSASSFGIVHAEEKARSRLFAHDRLSGVEYGTARS